MDNCHYTCNTIEVHIIKRKALIYKSLDEAYSVFVKFILFCRKPNKFEMTGYNNPAFNISLSLIFLLIGV